jgi:hypothetical protein
MELNGMVTKQVDIDIMCPKCKSKCIHMIDSEIDRITGDESWYFECRDCLEQFNINIKYHANEEGYPYIIVEEEYTPNEE